MRRNTLTLILILIVLAIIWFMTMFIPKPLETTPVPVDATSTPTAETNPYANTMCYLQHIDAARGSDDTYLEVKFIDNKQVSGKFNVLPAEKDKLTGPFVGSVTLATTTYGIITVDHTSTGEGTTTVEKRVFKLNEGEAEISWDLGKTFTQKLPQITCGTASSSVTL
ncbi:MAG: hypothetical protein V4576_02035 [Patescibacteria group bacterium]